MPKKKPKGRELTEKDKEKNYKISTKRILVENAIAGIKRLNIVVQAYRNLKEDFIFYQYQLLNYSLAGQGFSLYILFSFYF